MALQTITQGRRNHGVLVSAAVLLLAWSGLTAAQVPSVKIGTAEPVNPSTNYYDASSTSTNGLGWGRPNEIVELARALKKDPNLIYDFVRNNIDISWMYGLQKGALGALIDRSGTAFDQAKLMVDLLRESGFTASYQGGTITLNATQFSDWTGGITSATAACQLLSSGGIPASINGTYPANCSYGSATVTSVVMRHVWVVATIDGIQDVFDPAYKPYLVKPGIDLAAATGLTSGATLAAATGSGYTSGTVGTGVPYAQNLNVGTGTEAPCPLTTPPTAPGNTLYGKLRCYGSNLLATIQGNAALATAQVDDVIGGKEIIRFDSPPLRQTTLPYSSDTRGISPWTEIPDAYRTTLTVSLTKVDSVITNAVVFSGTDPHNILFADEIYGRKLIIDTDFDNAHTVSSSDAHFAAYLRVVDETLGVKTLSTFTNSDTIDYSAGMLTLSVNHPYAASSGGYMDVTTVKPITIMTPTLILHAWGEAGNGLVEKWGSRPDKKVPHVQDPNDCDLCLVRRGTVGDGRREKLGAAWIVQASRSAQMNATIAKSIYAMHHAIGVVAGDAQLHSQNFTYPTVYWYSISDNFDRIDVDSAISVTSTTANAADRRGALHVIAETSEALEGSVAAQVEDLPDTASTATRFEWANRPPTGTEEDPINLGPRQFLQFDSASSAQANSLILVEGVNSTTSDGLSGSNSNPILGSEETNDRKGTLSGAISAYTGLGFKIVTSREAFLGPGRRSGEISTTVDLSIPNPPPPPYTWVHRASKQRSGALVATKYDANGIDPVEIAHIVVGSGDTDIGYPGITKGGGGGAQPMHQEQFDPAEAADILKTRFVDKSSALGVDLQGGFVTYTSPASLTVGSGAFPYSLSANMIWRGGRGSSAAGYPVVHTQPADTWTTNWTSNLTISGSGLEAMGASDVRAAAGTIAAFYAAQDVYKSTQSLQRDITGVLVGAWWVQQMSGNVATAAVGTSTRQFVKLINVNDQWIAPGPSGYATLAQTGNRVVRVPQCGGGFPLTRGWDYTGMSFAVTNAHGDVQNFGFWQNWIGSDYCTDVHGFRLNSWVFPQGVTVNLVYTPGNTTAPDGSPAILTTDSLTEVNNTLGRKITFINSGLGGFTNGLTGGDARSVTVNSSVPLTHTDQIGNVTKFDFIPVPFYTNTISVLSQVTTADNTSAPSLQYTYDTQHRAKEARDAIALQQGTRGPYQFLIADGVRGERIDPAGSKYAVMYNLDHKPFRYINELDKVTSATYDGRGRVTQYVYPELDQENFVYDDRNNMTSLSKVPKPGSALAPIVLSALWDTAWNKPTWIKDGLTKKTDFTYYTSGSGKSLTHTVLRPSVFDPVSATNKRPTYTYTYNALGQPSAVTDPTNIVTQNTYSTDGSSNLLSSALNPTGINSITSYTYDPQGDVATTTDPRGYVTEAAYDQDRRKTTVKHHNGNISSCLLAAENTTYTQIGLEKLKQAASAISCASVSTWQTMQTYDYTPTSKVYRVTDASNRITESAYDAADRPTDSIQYLDAGLTQTRVTRTEYDDAGNVVKITKGYGSAKPITYATFTYTPNGQKDLVTDANNNTTQYLYDGFDRIFRTCFPDSVGACNASPTDYEEITLYDANSNVKTKRNRSGKNITFTYDVINRELTRVVPAPATPVGNTFGHTLTTSYDLASRKWDVSLLENNLTQTIQSRYDTAGRVQTVTDTGPVGTNAGLAGTNIADATLGKLTYGYDIAGNRTSMLVGGAGGYSVSYAYDGLNRMSSVSEVASGTSLTLATYAYDLFSRRCATPSSTCTWGNATTEAVSYEADGDMQSLTHVAGATTFNWAFGRNGAHQITSFNVNDNITMMLPSTVVTDAYAVNALNQYTLDNGTALTYDANGNLVSDGTYTYAYDEENRLRTANGAGNIASYGYDPMGRRTSKIANGITTRFLSDGAEEIADYTGIGALQMRYMYGSGMDDHIAMANASNIHSYYHVNHQGSVMAMSDAAGGVPTTYRYDAYGACTGGICDPMTGNPFRYTGRRIDAETGLYYYRARYYSTKLGRFLQTDPIGTKADINLYTYVGNDPMDFSDPKGLYSCGSKSAGDCAKVDKFVTAIGKAMKGVNPKSDSYKKLEKVSKALGTNDGKGIILNPTSNPQGSLGLAQPGGRLDLDIKQIAGFAASFSSSNPSMSGGDLEEGAGAGVVAHETRHALDAQRLGGPPATKHDENRTELNAYRTEQGAYKGLGMTTDIWSPQMTTQQEDAAVIQGAAASTKVWCGTSCPP